MDNMARNVVEMAALGYTSAELEAETGWTAAQIRRVLAEPAWAAARYEAQEIPRKWVLARQIHNARPGDCRRCRYRRDGVAVCVTPVCYQARWDGARDAHAARAVQTAGAAPGGARAARGAGEEDGGNGL